MNVFFLFCFWGNISSIPMLFVMLFAHGGKSSNSRSQMLFKTGVVKNFAVLTCSVRPVHYTFQKFYLMIDNWYFRVTFSYCKIRPCNRKTFAIDWLKIFVKRLLFVKQHGFFSSKNFGSWIISLLQRFVSSSNCEEKLLASNWTILVSYFSKCI